MWAGQGLALNKKSSQSLCLSPRNSFGWKFLNIGPVIVHSFVRNTPNLQVYQFTSVSSTALGAKVCILAPSSKNAEVSAEVRDLCIKEFWLPDAEILNLKEFKTLDVLSKLEGLWLNRNFEIMYAVATRITFICPMHFTSFPLDVQGAIHKLR